MIRPSEALRLLHINWVLLQNGLDEVILAAHIFRPIRFLIYLSPFIGQGATDFRPIQCEFGKRSRILAPSS